MMFVYWDQCEIEIIENFKENWGLLSKGVGRNMIVAVIIKKISLDKISFSDLIQKFTKGLRTMEILLVKTEGFIPLYTQCYQNLFWLAIVSKLCGCRSRILQYHIGFFQHKIRQICYAIVCQNNFLETSLGVVWSIVNLKYLHFQFFLVLSINSMTISNIS